MKKLFNIYEYNNEDDLNDFLNKMDISKAVLLSIQANMKANDMKCFDVDEQKVLLRCVELLLNIKNQEK